MATGLLQTTDTLLFLFFCLTSFKMCNRPHGFQWGLALLSTLFFLQSNLLLLYERGKLLSLLLWIKNLKKIVYFIFMKKCCPLSKQLLSLGFLNLLLWCFFPHKQFTFYMLKCVLKTIMWPKIIILQLVIQTGCFLVLMYTVNKKMMSE